jgi:hypothetical protein
MNGQPTRPSDPVVVGDYDESLYSGNGGTISSYKFKGLNPGDFGIPPCWGYVILNATGINWINKGGITKLCMRSSYDIAGTPPTGPAADQLTIEGPLHVGAHDPYLEVGYLTPGTLKTANGMVDSGEISFSDGDYGTAWGSATGWVYTGEENKVGQRDTGFVYVIYRGMLFFDTRQLLPGDNIIDAVVALYGYSDNSWDNFNITVQEPIPAAPHKPLVVGDYNQANYTKSRGTLNTSFWKVEDWNYVFLSNFSAYVPGGITPMVLRSNTDIGAAPPGFMRREFVSYYSPDATDPLKVPQLILTLMGGRQLIAPPSYSLTWESGSFGR